MWKSLDDVLEVLNGGRDREKADVGGGLGNCFKRLFVFVQQKAVVLLDGVFSVQNMGEVERYPDMNVHRSSHISSSVFEEEFAFCQVKALRID